MTTTDFFTDASTDARILCESTTTYAAARDGTAPISPNLGAAIDIVGQYGDATPLFDCYQILYAFDTSVIGSGTVNSATLSLPISGDASATDFTIEAYTQAWLAGGLTNADFMTQAELAAGTIIATLSTVGLSVGVYVAMSDSGAGVASVVNKTGFTEFVLASSRHRAGNQPSGNEYVQVEGFNDGGLVPKLTVNYTPPVPAPEVLRTVSSGRRW